MSWLRRPSPEKLASVALDYAVLDLELNGVMRGTMESSDNKKRCAVGAISLAVYGSAHGSFYQSKYSKRKNCAYSAAISSLAREIQCTEYMIMRVLDRTDPIEITSAMRRASKQLFS